MEEVPPLVNMIKHIFFIIPNKRIINTLSKRNFKTKSRSVVDSEDDIGYFMIYVKGKNFQFFLRIKVRSMVLPLFLF